MAKKFFTWLLLFIGISLVLQSFQGEEEPEGIVDDVVLTATESSYNMGDPVMIDVTNHLDQILRIDSECPSEPLDIERYSNGVWKTVSVEKGLYIACDDDSADEKIFFQQTQFIEVSPNDSRTVDYSPWTEGLFQQMGRYRATLKTEIAGVEKAFTTEFEIGERGFFSSVSYHLFYRPIYNFLLFLTSVLPGYSFGLAVIALTLIIRLLLMLPNQKALRSQRSMMKIQPEIEAIKKKYKGNQEKISRETMALWKKHRVNPVGGCLPMLIQLPILIALFYVVKSGFSPYEGSIIYGFFQNIDLTAVDTNFYGILDLQEVNMTWLPLLVGLLQFFQLKLSFSRKVKGVQKTAHGKEIIDVGEDVSKKPKKEESSKKFDPKDPMKMMSKSMLYFMPVMIALMAASLPSGVGLYLMISTMFGIAQQYYVNRDVA